MKTSKFIIGIFLSVIYLTTSYSQDTSAIFNSLDEMEIPNKIGLNGSFIGVHNNALIIAGGANFPNTPVWDGGKKVWHKTIYVLEKSGDLYNWSKTNLELPKPIAYGVSVNTPKGVLCIGGNNESDTFNEVFLLKWNKKSKTIEIENLPPMPITLASMGGSVIDGIVYLVGGQETNGGNSTSNFLSINISSSLNRPIYTWKTLENFPGKERSNPIVSGQSNGHQDCLYVFSGVSYNSSAEYTHEMLDDVYEFDPFKNSWSQKKSIPNNGTPGVKGGFISAAPSIELGDSHIIIFGGAGGEQQHLAERLEIGNKIQKLEKLEKLEILNDSLQAELTSLRLKITNLMKNTSFSNKIWAYHTITDTWSLRGELKKNTQVVTKAIRWNDNILIPGGEIRPCVRTNKITVLKMKQISE